MSRHPAVEQMLEFFEYDHLPSHLQAVSKPVGELAYEMAELLPDDPQLTTGLQKLIEAKDCFVRAQVRASKKVDIKACDHPHHSMFKYCPDKPETAGD